MTLSLYEHTGAAPATGLASGISNADMSFTVLSGSGYPTGAVGPFVVCIDAGTAGEEKILCSARSGVTFTVTTRGYDGTSAAPHASGVTNVTHVWSAAEAQDVSAHIYTTSRDDHTQYTRTDGTRAFTGTTAISATPGSSAPGDVPAKGSALTLALSDHVHGREAAPGSARVDTSESTTSNTYTDLATTTDSVTFTVPASGNVNVSLSAYCSLADSVGTFVSVALSGANTVAALDTNAVLFKAVQGHYGLTIPLTGLSAGSTTFKMKYKSGSGATSTLAYRTIIVAGA